MKRFFQWRHLRTLLLLALHRATPVRALTEGALEALVSNLQINQMNGRVLVAGGDQESGSEHVILSALPPSNSIIFVNIDPKCHPTVLVDLSSP